MSETLRDPGGGRIRDRTPASPEDLVTIRGFRGRRIQLHRNAAQAYQNMLTAFRSETGIQGVLSVISGYRSPVKQQQLWRKALQKYGTLQVARRWVAPPGHSAHQTGRALDFDLGAPIGSRFVNQQRRTRAFRWLRDNASRFDFYPYEREPWHWEYNPRGGIGGHRSRIANLGKRSLRFIQPPISRAGMEEIMQKGIYVPGVWGEEISLGKRPSVTPIVQPPISKRLEREIMQKGIYVPGVWGEEIHR